MRIERQTSKLEKRDSQRQRDEVTCRKKEKIDIYYRTVVYNVSYLCKILPIKSYSLLCIGYLNK